MCEAAKVKVLIADSDTILSRAVEREFKTANLHEIDHINFEKTPKEQIKQAFQAFKPQVVIILSDNEKYIDSSEYISWIENTITVAAESSSWPLFISSDQVFDGKVNNYKPNSAKNPVTKLGKFYNSIEDLLLHKIPSAGVLRLSGQIYGTVSPSDTTSFIGTILHKLKNNTNHEFDITPVPVLYANDVALICSQLIERKQKHCNFIGVWHWGSDDKLSELLVAQEIAKLLKLSHENLKEKHNVHDNNLITLDSTALHFMGLGNVTHLLPTLPHLLQQTQ